LIAAEHARPAFGIWPFAGLHAGGDNRSSIGQGSGAPVPELASAMPVLRLSGFTKRRAAALLKRWAWASGSRGERQQRHRLARSNQDTDQFAGVVAPRQTG